MLYRLSLAVLTAVIVIGAALASVNSWVQTSLDSPLRVGENGMLLEVAPGDSLSLLARRLAASGVIDSPYPLLLHARLSGEAHILQGTYDIEAGATLRGTLDRLVQGDVQRFRITFPEGRSLVEWLDLINDHDKLSRDGPLDLETVEAHFTPPVGDSLEGWFFPDTYLFPHGTSGLKILEQAMNAMNLVLAEEWAGRSEPLPLVSPYQALILASIVEKETGVPSERKDIAGVFVRRLEKGMKLQTDPTVIYGLGRQFDGNLTRSHLRQENPYNTYYINGLPPTPITNPGREAIHAAVHPNPGTALFFVAKGDGSHHFSATLAEHRKAVRQYQLRRAKDYRSAPQ